MEAWIESLSSVVVTQSEVVVMHSEVVEGLLSWCMSKRVFQLLSAVSTLSHQLHVP